MIIKRVLNNNAVSCLDEMGNEVIIKGKGIAYHLSSGDAIDDNKIEKKFVLENKEINRRFQEILFTIPEDCIEISEKIITMIKSNLSKDVSDIIYVTLTDHISNVLERIRMGILFDNSLLWDIKRTYTEEYHVGLQAVKMLREYFHIKLEDDEASFIALHIVNAELNVEIKDVYVITELIEDIYRYIADTFALDESMKDELAYNRFILHLRFFFERIIQHGHEQENKRNEILDIMKMKYRAQYDSVEHIVDMVYHKFKRNVSDEEKLYVLIHVVKLTT